MDANPGPCGLYPGTLSPALQNFDFYDSKSHENMLCLKIVFYIHLLLRSGEIPDFVKSNVIMFDRKACLSFVYAFKMFFFTLEIELSWWFFFILGYLFYFAV